MTDNNGPALVHAMENKLVEFLCRAATWNEWQRTGMLPMQSFGMLLDETMKSFLDQLAWMRRGLDEMDAMQTAVEDSVQNAVNNALAELQHQGGPDKRKDSQFDKTNARGGGAFWGGQEPVVSSFCWLHLFICFLPGVSASSYTAPPKCHAGHFVISNLGETFVFADFYSMTISILHYNGTVAVHMNMTIPTKPSLGRTFRDVGMCLEWGQVLFDQWRGLSPSAAMRTNNARVRPKITNVVQIPSLLLDWLAGTWRLTLKSCGPAL
ncbi:hypothetical protein B0H13DRAFT_1922398 [Mycena leptocephala]|nr:hypothetical protein B0H13DRAFT_1922398 [Mycena leptocephala]